MKDIEHIFFDLDRTLWDFEKNSGDTLSELFQELKLAEAGIPDVNAFIHIYVKMNDLCWQLYRENKISKAELRTIRFEKALNHFKVQNQHLTHALAELYVERSPFKTALFPGTIETLQYLSLKYSLHIITNGFEEVQHIKLRESGMRPYFKHIITSERAGCKKPDKQIFQFALGSAGASSYNSLMIGDDFEVDVKGAMNAGLQAIHFYPEMESEYFGEIKTINDLAKLKNIL